MGPLALGKVRENYLSCQTTKEVYRRLNHLSMLILSVLTAVKVNIQQK